MRLTGCQRALPAGTFDLCRMTGTYFPSSRNAVTQESGAFQLIATSFVEYDAISSA